jgi:hypothetical protein
MKGTIRSAALMLGLVATAAAARAGEVTLDTAGGSVFATWTDGTRTIDYVHTPNGPWVGLEAVAKPGAQPLIGVSHSVAGVGIHSGLGGAASLTTSLFWVGVGAEASGTIGLRNTQTGQTTWPSAVRTIALDPTEPSGSSVLLDASHVYLPRKGLFRALALVRRGSGEAVLVDYDLGSGTVRRTPLGFTPPIGSNKGSFVGTSDGHVWAAFASTGAIRLFDLGDLSAPGPLQPVGKQTLSVSGLDPDSTHLGIIAILIGVVAQPSISLRYQAGDALYVAAFDGAAFRQVARQEMAAGARGIMIDDGIWFFMLPYIEQDNLYQQYRDFAADGKLTMGEN